MNQIENITNCAQRRPLPQIRQHNRRRCGRGARGFTLIELLVVISIIALLISLLLPALAEAKRDAETVVCAANLHSIGQAMMEYSTTWNGAIAGSGWTSGAFFWSDPENGIPAAPYNASNYPNDIAQFDWMSPLAHEMNLSFTSPTLSDPLAASNNDRIARFVTEADSSVFICPANNFLAPITPPGGSSASIQRMVSYCAAGEFLMKAASKTSPSGLMNVLFSTPNYVQLPGNYTPNVNDVGQPSGKVYLADGAGFSNTIYTPRTFLTSPLEQMSGTVSAQSGGSPFADIGAFDQWSDSWNRDSIPAYANGGSFARDNEQGGPGAKAFDARGYAFRHGSPGTYNMNLLFFDGHVELLNDVAAANPALWAPAGSIIKGSEPTVDVEKKYFGGQTTFYVPG